MAATCYKSLKRAIYTGVAASAATFTDNTLITPRSANRPKLILRTAPVEQSTNLATLPIGHGLEPNRSWLLFRRIFATNIAAEHALHSGHAVSKGPFSMIKVKSRGNETAEQMLRRFKKMCEKEGLTKDIKRVAYYEKPSEKRRRRARKTPPRMGMPMRG
jgi:small subunit ribosomal protein S21